MLGIIEDEEEKTEAPKVTKKKMGRPKLPEDQKKKHHTIKLRDEIWDLLSTIGGGNRARAIEELVEDHFIMLKEKYGKKS